MVWGNGATGNIAPVLFLAFCLLWWIRGAELLLMLVANATATVALSGEYGDCTFASDTMPIDRMRMRPWLQKQIESSQIPGLKWLNKEEQIFQIPWIHASHQMWDLEKDAPLFMRWAIHTAKYRPGVDSPNPKTWKSNFRCALNSLSDIVEVKDKTNRKGSNAFRVFKMLSVERSTERGIKKLTKKIVKDSQIQSRSERCIPEAGLGGDAKTDASRVKQEPTEVDVNDFEIKEEPDDFPIEDIVRVRIGENGDVEETDEPVFRVNPQTRAQRGLRWRIEWSMDFIIIDENPEDDVLIRDEPVFNKPEEFAKPEEEDYPYTIIAVTIGDNGNVEETDDSAFSLETQRLAPNHEQESTQENDSSETDNSEDWNDFSESLEPSAKRAPNKQLPTKLLLRSHLYHHKTKDLKKFACKECGLRFRDEEWLVRHMEIHDSARPFHCEICDKRFSQQFAYDSHKRIHTDERPYPCTVCNHSFKHRSNLRFHMRTHTGEKPFSCPICFQGFTRNSSVRRHVEGHKGYNRGPLEGATQPFICSICGFGFNTKLNLLYHKRSHKTRRPLRCVVCKAKHYSMQELNDHMRMHSCVVKLMRMEEPLDHSDLSTQESPVESVAKHLDADLE
uniref:Uncharacterized protein n=1 Tax=Knipowitschia caucasica TaxID=637954 RepID=A0AAV2MM01_KNICA